MACDGACVRMCRVRVCLTAHIGRNELKWQFVVTISYIGDVEHRTVHCAVVPPLLPPDIALGQIESAWVTRLGAVVESVTHDKLTVLLDATALVGEGGALVSVVKDVLELRELLPHLSLFGRVDDGDDFDVLSNASMLSMLHRVRARQRDATEAAAAAAAAPPPHDAYAVPPVGSALLVGSRHPYPYDCMWLCVRRRLWMMRVLPCQCQSALPSWPCCTISGRREARNSCRPREAIARCRSGRRMASAAVTTRRNFTVGHGGGTGRRCPSQCCDVDIVGPAVMSWGGADVCGSDARNYAPILCSQHGMLSEEEGVGEGAESTGGGCCGSARRSH